MTDYLCPNCSVKLYKINNKLVCGGENCDFQCLVADYATKSEPWHLRVGKDESLWKATAYNEYPYIIASEYKRLNDLLVENKLYGMMLQFKDVFEIILKLPTLLYLNNVIANKSRVKEENELITFFISKRLSLGDWHVLAKKSAVLCEDKNLIAILTDVVKLYEKNKIIKWRNETIGHGALMFDHTDEFREDLRDKLAILKGHFDQCHQAYLALGLTYKTKKATVELKGSDFSKHLLNTKGTLYWGQKQPINDLILIHDKELFFFDSFLSRDKKAKLLNYIDAKVIKLRLKYLEELHKNIPRALLLESDDYSKLEDDVYVESEAKMVNFIAKTDQTIVPSHIKDWLCRQMNTNPKGVFLLQMEEGMGKTTFSKLLDPHESGKVKLDGVSVRSYYINGSYAYKGDIFQNDMVETLKYNRDRTDRLKGNLPDFKVDSKLSLDKQFAALINDYHQLYVDKFNNDKLLIVVDGLDEIPNLRKESVLDYMPSAEDLADGVYVLMTSRLQDEALEQLNDKIDDLLLTDRLILKRDNQAYLDVLKTYIGSKLKVNSDDLVEAIIKHSDAKFGYIKPVESIMKHHELEDISSVNVFGAFLGLLKKNYTTKYYKQIIRLISLLAIARDGLTLEEIAYLLDDEKADFKLLAFLTDIDCLLTQNRSYRGSLFALSHTGLKEFVVQHYADEIKQLLQKWLHDFRAIDYRNLKTEDKYIVLNLLYFTKTYMPQNVQSLLNEKNMDVRLIVETIVKADASSNDMKLLLLFMDDLIEVLEEAPKKNAQALVEAYLSRMSVYVNYGFGRVAGNRNYIDQALAIMETYKFKNNRLKIEALKIRSEYHRKIGYTKKSMEDMNAANELMASLSNNDIKKMGLPAYEKSNMYLSRGINFKNLNQIEKALKLSMQARDFVATDQSYEGRMAYSNALNIIGLCYIKMDKINEAESNIKQALEICEELVIESGQADKEIFNLYANLGQVLRKKKDYKGAVLAYTKAIDEITHLESQDGLVDLNLKAMQYNGRGNIYLDIGQLEYAQANYKRALADYLKGIEIIETLDKSNQNLRLLDQLFVNVHNIYENYLQMPRKAKEYKAKVDEMGSKLGLTDSNESGGSEGKKVSSKSERITNLLEVRRLFDLGVKYFGIRQHQEAKESYSQAIDLLKKMERAGHNKKDIDSYLWQCYVNRAGVEHRLIDEKRQEYDKRAESGSKVKRDFSMFKTHKVINDYLKAISLYTGNDSFKSELYENLSTLYCYILRDYGKAKSCVLKSIEISPLRELAYCRLGDIYYEMEKFEDASQSYRRALAVNPDFELAAECLQNSQLRLLEKEHWYLNF